MNLVKSREFRSRLAIAARVTAKTNNETGFKYYRDLSTATDMWSPVFEGTELEMRPSRFTDWMFDHLPYESIGDCYELLTLHTHGYPSSGLALSHSDVELTCSASYDEDVRPCVCIATLDPSDLTKGHMLMMQRLCKEPYFHATEIPQKAWRRALAVENEWPSERVADALTEPGYLASTVIPFDTMRSPSYAQVSVTNGFLRLAGLRDP